MPTITELGHAGPIAAESLCDVLELTACGDVAAFERLYAATVARITDVARHVLVDWAQAEEVAQEVLLEAWRTAVKFDRTKGSAMAWLITMTHRRAVDRVRAEQAARRRDHGQWAHTTRLDGAQLGGELTDTVVTHLHHEASVRLGLDQLTTKQREVIVLAYYGGLSYPEVARVLGLPLSTTKTRIRDGLRRMRPMIEPDALIA